MNRARNILLLWVTACLLAGCSHDRMRYEGVLDQAERQNVNYDSITNLDSIKLAVEFMDAHGSDNERIRAHYLLGCAYRDMGEAPLALECYQDAAICADTTKADCDYRQLTKVHSQMAALFYHQKLPYEMRDELDLQYKYALLSGNKKNAINAFERKAGSYEILGMSDSIIRIRETAHQLYKQNGFDKEAALAIGPIILILIDKGNLPKAKRYMDIYESESGVWKNGWIDKQRVIYYYTKGKYYLASEKPDSAKYFFQKLLSSSYKDEQVKAGYRGLYLLYKKTGQKDSLAKYADLCYRLNDACYASKATGEMRQMQALYNYTRSQKEANSMRARADRNKLMLMAALVVLILVLFILEKVRRKQMKTKKENDDLLEENTELEEQKSAAENKLKEVTGKESLAIRKGARLYDQIASNKPVANWLPEDYGAFIGYYEATHYDSMRQIRKQYGELTNRKMLLVILEDMGKSTDDICQIMSLEKGSLRSLRFRLRNSKE